MSLKVFYSLYVVYLILCMCLTMIESFFSSLQKKVIVSFLIFLMAIYTGLRPINVPDTQQYIRFFYNNLTFPISIENLFGFGLRYDGIEYFFVQMTHLFRKLIPSHRVFFIFTSLVSSSLTLCGLVLIENSLKENSNYEVKKTNNSELRLWTLYCLRFGLLYNCVALRSGLTMGICLFAIGLFLSNKGFSKYLLPLVLIFFASLLQTAAIIYYLFLVVIFLNITIGNRHFAAIWILSVALIVTGVSGRIVNSVITFVFLVKDYLKINAFNSYLVASDATISFQYMYRVFFEGFIILFVLLLSNGKTNKRNQNLLFISSIGIVGATFGYRIESAYRIFDYFSYFYLPLISNYLGRKNVLTTNKVCSTFCLLSMVPIQFIIVLHGSGIGVN